MILRKTGCLYVEEWNSTPMSHRAQRWNPKWIKSVQSQGSPEWMWRVDEVLSEYVLLRWAWACQGTKLWSHGKLAKASWIRLRTKLPPVKIGVFTNNWPVYTKTSKCHFHLRDIYSLRLITYRDFLLRLASPSPILYVITGWGSG